MQRIDVKRVADRKWIGLDPGFRNLGWSAFEIKDGEWWVNGRGTIVLPEEIMGKHEQDARRKYDRFLSPESMLYLSKEFRSLLLDFAPTDVCYERIFFGRNVSSIVGVIEVCGMIKALAAERKCLVYQYTPQTIKISATGDKFANKDKVWKFIEELTDINPETDHAADAMAVCLTHLLHLRGQRNGT